MSTHPPMGARRAPPADPAPPETLFARLRRHRPSAYRDAAEDRLTESLAATLERAPDAARAIARAWFGVDPSGALSVRTQLVASTTERIDLALVFGPTHRPELTIWFEAKVGAQPTRGQAVRYLERLATVPGYRHLSWLLPAGVEVAGGSPDGAPVHTWQELATLLDAWHTGSGNPSGFAEGMVHEFTRHLEEIGLAAIGRFDEHDAYAINGHRRAARRLNEVVRQATEIISAKRGIAHRKPGRSPLDFWFHANRGASWTGSGYFELYGRLDEARTAPCGDWVIGGGVSWPAAQAPRDIGSPWFQRRWEQGFEYGRSGPTQYLFRYLDLSELAAIEALGDQAQHLAEWALATWTMLDDDPLPAP